MKRATLILVALTLLFHGEQANGSLITGPVPDSDTVVYNGLRWAYASPVASDTFGSNTLLQPSDNLNVGWRFATPAELALRPPLALFQALPGGSNAAVPYWNTDFTHVDEGDYAAGAVTSVRWNDPQAPSGANDRWDTVYVKDLATVPEPASLTLFGMAAVAAYFGWRRRKQPA